MIEYSLNLTKGFLCDTSVLDLMLEDERVVYSVSMRIQVRIVTTQKQCVRNSLGHGIHSTK